MFPLVFPSWITWRDCQLRPGRRMALRMVWMLCAASVVSLVALSAVWSRNQDRKVLN